MYCYKICYRFGNIWKIVLKKSLDKNFDLEKTIIINYIGYVTKSMDITNGKDTCPLGSFPINTFLPKSRSYYAVYGFYQKNDQSGKQKRRLA